MERTTDVGLLQKGFVGLNAGSNWVTHTEEIGLVQEEGKKRQRQANEIEVVYHEQSMTELEDHNLPITSSIGSARPGY